MVAGKKIMAFEQKPIVALSTNQDHNTTDRKEGNTDWIWNCPVYMITFAAAWTSILFYTLRGCRLAFVTKLQQY